MNLLILLKFVAYFVVKKENIQSKWTMLFEFISKTTYTKQEVLQI